MMFHLPTCYFKGCARPTVEGAIKCEFHKQRSICLVQDCRNQVFARNLCVRHGGKKTCVYEGCHQNVRLGNLCGKHGAGSTRKLCVEDGCTKFAQTKQRCSAHGGGQRCKLPGCSTHARRGGFCTRHTNQVTRPSLRVAATANIALDKFAAYSKMNLHALLNPDSP
ncbi:hypothetical protein H310_03046 [Aphanomyces invadans]|uniref:WRKY19-like zinc finger domain-containing protein n=2 Tax=Aphanomyces invadans TaxID=157072 RepID=A0A024ULA5_9STRA|nr:hypothetical protein H310_03046 [Aphanomyces invadans]ETW06935.1 hypothetical protein H310_03046 [Aphanomyces invadans]|eukprot:XP_008865010.1 hypothetical protein H310_03046 [Aphanomyces invadans]